MVTTEKTAEKILSLILENPNITTEELARLCDMTPDGVYYHTKRLREKGVLIREGGRVNQLRIKNIFLYASTFLSNDRG